MGIKTSAPPVFDNNLTTTSIAANNPPFSYHVQEKLAMCELDHGMHGSTSNATLMASNVTVQWKAQRMHFNSSTSTCGVEDF